MDAKPFHRYVMELTRSDGNKVGSPKELTLDWTPAEENGSFSALRTGCDAKVVASSPVVISPRWDDHLGEPYLQGVWVELPETGTKVSCDLHYFRNEARQFAGQLIEEKALKEGDAYHYQVCAYRKDAEAESLRSVEGSFAIEDAPIAAPVRVAMPTQALGNSTLVATDHHQPEDVSVYIPSQVMRECESITEQAEDHETGGILIGFLHHDPSGSDLMVTVTAQIPAAHTVTASTSLTFTADTWAAVQTALALRRSDEIMLGWWHSHPARSWCGKDCPPENRKKCALQRSFFSDTDKHLHRTMFCKAWCVGLLFTDSDDGIKPSLWGWRQGIVQRRAFLTDQPETSPPGPELNHSIAGVHPTPINA